MIPTDAEMIFWGVGAILAVIGLIGLVVAAWRCSE
jgi:hypothetical protein